jgi:ABC-type transport system substrate-binding protein
LVAASGDPGKTIPPTVRTIAILDSAGAPFHWSMMEASCQSVVKPLADPFAYIYEKAILERDPHWYEKNVMGSGPFKFVSYDAGQSITALND